MCFLFLYAKGLYFLLLVIFLFAVSTSVNLVLLISENKYLVKLLLDSSDTSWIHTLEHILHRLRKSELLLVHDN